jgi:hypothetical protein
MIEGLFHGVFLLDRGAKDFNVPYSFFRQGGLLT